MKRSPLLVVLIGVLLVTGCDPIYGVSRRARVASMPGPASAEATIRKATGVTNVLYRHSQGGRPLTITGIKAPDQVHDFFYEGGANIHGNAQFIVDYRGRVGFSQTLLRMFQPPPQEWVDCTRPVMVEIETLLESECGLTGLRTSVVEHCWGVKCK